MPFALAAAALAARGVGLPITRLLAIVVENLRAFLAGEPTNVVNR